MIKPTHRFFADDGRQFPEPKPTQWSLLDYDTRRWILVEGPAEPFADDTGDAAAKAIAPVMDGLSEDVTKVVFSADGRLLKTSNDPKDDCTPIINFPSFTHDLVGKRINKVLKRNEMVELKRLSAFVDLMKVTGTSRHSHVVFKYCLITQPRALPALWKEAFLHEALSENPNVVPFHRFVVDEVQSRFLGYTTEYIHGGSMDHRHISIFKRKWLLQLFQLIDDLHLKYGLVHQDIGPRNLVLDEKTDRLLLFDFEMATFWGSAEVEPEVDDMTDLVYTIYEILTGDFYHSEDGRRLGRSAETILQRSPWKLKKGLKLEPNVTTRDIKDMLSAWITTRKLRPSPDPANFKLRSHIIWPNMVKIYTPSIIETDHRQRALYRRHAHRSAHIVRWERPPDSHSPRQAS